MIKNELFPMVNIINMLFADTTRIIEQPINERILTKLSRNERLHFYDFVHGYREIVNFAVEFTKISNKDCIIYGDYSICKDIAYDITYMFNCSVESDLIAKQIRILGLSPEFLLILSER